MDLKTIKTLTASRLQILQQVDAGVLRGEEGMQSLLEYVYAVSQPILDLAKAAESKDDWKTAVLVFGDSIDVTEAARIEQHITKDFERIEKASVQPKKGKESKKD